jgi:hypothetical protein
LAPLEHPQCVSRAKLNLDRRQKRNAKTITVIPVMLKAVASCQSMAQQ